MWGKINHTPWKNLDYTTGRWRLTLGDDKQVGVTYNKDAREALPGEQEDFKVFQRKIKEAFPYRRTGLKLHFYGVNFLKYNDFPFSLRNAWGMTFRDTLYSLRYTNCSFITKAQIEPDLRSLAQSKGKEVCFQDCQISPTDLPPLMEVIVDAKIPSFELLEPGYKIYRIGDAVIFEKFNSSDRRDIDVFIQFSAFLKSTKSWQRVNQVRFRFCEFSKPLLKEVLDYAASSGIYFDACHVNPLQLGIWLGEHFNPETVFSFYKPVRRRRLKHDSTPVHNFSLDEPYTMEFNHLIIGSLDLPVLNLRSFFAFSGAKLRKLDLSIRPGLEADMIRTLEYVVQATKTNLVTYIRFSVGCSANELPVAGQIRSCLKHFSKLKRLEIYLWGGKDSPREVTKQIVRTMHENELVYWRISHDNLIEEWITDRKQNILDANVGFDVVSGLGYLKANRRSD